MFESASLLLLLQGVLLEVEEKVSALSELSMRSDSLLLESPAHTREEAQRLASRLQALKGGLLELQRMLQDKQTSIQVGAFLSFEHVSDIWTSRAPHTLIQPRTTRSHGGFGVCSRTLHHMGGN